MSAANRPHKCSGPRVHELLDRHAQLLAVGLSLALLTLISGAARAAGPAPGEETIIARFDPTLLGSYCGVQSLYRAARALGKEVDFAVLVKPEYISSQQGSSVADLKRAGADLGVLVEPMSRMTCQALRQVECPVILHVKSDLESKYYDHWVLFMGTEGGKAKIYDRYLPAADMDFEELAARWDGNGLLVSDVPVNKTAIWLAVLCPFLLFGGLAALGVGLVFRFEARGLKSGGNISRFAAVRGSVAQAAGLLLIALGVAGAYQAIGREGLLSCQQAIAAIQNANLGSFLPKVKTGELTRRLDDPGTLIVDARRPHDFNLGHIRGAISIPFNATASQYREALAAVPKDYRIVVYSHSNGCAYGDQVAAKLISLGYHNVALYRGGWVEWEKEHAPPGKGRQLAKGDQG